MDNAGRTGDAVPRAETCDDAVTCLILNEHIEHAAKYEKYLFDFMGMGGIALARFHKHDREREISSRDRIGIVMFSRAARSDEAMLRPFKAFDLRVFER